MSAGVHPSVPPVPDVAALLQPGALQAVYQPIVRLADRGIEGFEALTRPRQAPVPDIEGLFNAAEALGRGAELDWAARRASISGIPSLPERSLVFLNIHTAALLSPLHGADQMVLLAESAGRAPSDIVIEISERVRLRHPRRLSRVLTEYWSCGFRFALDDVGEGFSTLAAACAISPDYLKIGGSVVRGAGHSPQARGTVRQVVALAELTGAQVIAEGLETDEQATLMAELGSPLGQGFVLGRPAVPFHAMTRAVLENHRALVRAKATDFCPPLEIHRREEWVH